MQFIGVIAQLVERCNGIAEVSGSNPLSSICTFVYIRTLSVAFRKLMSFKGFFATSY